MSTSATFKFAPSVNQLLLDVFETLSEDSDLSRPERKWYSMCDMVYQGLSAADIRKEMMLRFPNDHQSPAPSQAGSGGAILTDCLARSQYDVLSKIASKIRFGKPVHDTDQKRKKLAESALAASTQEGRFCGGRPAGKQQVCRVCRLPWDDERAIGTRQKNIHQENKWSHVHSRHVEERIHTFTQTRC